MNETTTPGEVRSSEGLGLEPEATVDSVEWLRAKYRRHGEIEDDRAADEIERLRAALYVYAAPGFYHACEFRFDRPTGGFDEDFDYSEEYERDMPGKLARAALGPNV